MTPCRTRTTDSCPGEASARAGHGAGKGKVRGSLRLYTASPPTRALRDYHTVHAFCMYKTQPTGQHAFRLCCHLFFGRDSFSFLPPCSSGGPFAFLYKGMCTRGDAGVRNSRASRLLMSAPPKQPAGPLLRLCISLLPYCHPLIAHSHRCRRTRGVACSVFCPRLPMILRTAFPGTLLFPAEAFRCRTQIMSPIVASAALTYIVIFLSCFPCVRQVTQRRPAQNRGARKEVCAYHDGVAARKPKWAHATLQAISFYNRTVLVPSLR